MKERLSEINKSLFDLIGRLLPNISDNNLVSKLIIAAFATLIAFILFVLVRGITKFIEKRVLLLQSRKLQSLKIQSQQIFTENQITSAIGFLFKWFRYLCYLIIFYLYINIIFSFFPVTSGISAMLLAHFMDAMNFVFGSIWGYMPNLLILIIISAVGYYIIKAINIFFKGVEDERITLTGFYPEWAGPTYTISKILLIALLVIIAFPYLPGKNSPAFQAVSIFLGVLVSLGSTAAVANVVAGIVLTYMRAFKIGDRVQIADTTGDIVEKTMFVTRIRTIKNVEITVPNAMVLNDHIINYSSHAQEHGLILHSKVTIGYDVPWKKVHELLIQAAHATEGLESSPEPFVLQTSLDDFYVEYEINAYTKNPKTMAVTYNELHRNIQNKFHESGVEIASPGLLAYRDGNKENIPDEYLPQKKYDPPKIGPLSFGPSSKKPEQK